jgi:hypothetical protein
MFNPGFDQNKETVDDSAKSAISEEDFSEEEFKAVFGGTVPVSTPWAGLLFI